jgi:N-acylneuraminate cytidylyltransferase
VKVAVIPARGGSKRIPRKNVRSFAGAPMIVHSIAQARASGVFDRVIVSTDDEEIAHVARRSGAEVPFTRPAAIADDHAGTGAVIAHAVAFLRDHGYSLSAVCCIYPTAPFVRAEDIREGLSLLESRDLDYVFSATSYAYPIFRSFRESDGGGLEMFFPDRYESRSQDLPEALHDAGQFYWGRPEAWLEQRAVFGKGATVVRIPRWRVQDIDTEEDWVRAESIASYLGLRAPAWSTT